MKTGVHPAYHPVTVTCACGAEYQIGSTDPHFTRVDICAACHPFFTGTQRFLDTAGRVEKFRKRFAATGGQTAVRKKPSRPVSRDKAKKGVNILEGLQSIRKKKS